MRNRNNYYNAMLFFILFIALNVNAEQVVIEYGFCSVHTSTGQEYSVNGKSGAVKKKYVTSIVDSTPFRNESSPPTYFDGKYSNDFIFFIDSIKGKGETFETRLGKIEPSCQWKDTFQDAVAKREEILTFNGNPEGSMSVVDSGYTFPDKPTDRFIPMGDSGAHITIETRGSKNQNKTVVNQPKTSTVEADKKSYYTCVKLNWKKSEDSTKAMQINSADYWLITSEKKPQEVKELFTSKTGGANVKMDVENPISSCMRYESESEAKEKMTLIMDRDKKAPFIKRKLQTVTL